jgi:diaminohydroxyphosphoribosylaminopyrimidine deaminase/5-amino-6-(5-phosphoribosylamino)uracil reductase
MRRALGLARRGLGRVAPNPAVGCVLVRADLGSSKSGRIVGAGWTQPGGRPHAETEAIAQAGKLAKGAHAFVTLEPCNHQGQTGPCTEALIDAGVSAVTIATEDPDPRVSGSGVQRLKDAGIDVRCGLLEAEARLLNAGFFSRVTQNRPWVTMKTATTMDGAIASRNGKSQWITGPEARMRGHLYRAENDAILTGIGTVREDDPELTCRLPGMADRSPVRVVVDPRLEIDIAAKLFDSLETAPLWLLAGDGGYRRWRSWKPWPGAALPAFCWKPAARSAHPSSMPGWSTKSPGSAPPASWAATACRRSHRWPSTAPTMHRNSSISRH